VQRDRERHLCVLFEQPGHIDIDQNDAGVGQFCARGLGHGFEVAVESAQNAAGNAETLAAQRLRPGHRRAGDDGIQQRHVRDRAAHRADGIAGVADRDHHVGIVVAALAPPLPTDGRKPTMPVSAAGTRVEPPVSDPSPQVTMPAAIAAAVPPEEPPGIRVLS
jgi:hypothetical protein